ncbi:Transmembrane protein [Dirofilaria immitis]
MLHRGITVCLYMAFQNYRLRSVETWRAFRSRRRLDTIHTAESFDSGISSLNTHGSGYRTKLRRNLEIDDILWCCSFLLTVWYFELPIPLFIDARVDWFFLSCSILCQLSFFLIGLYLYSKNDRNSTDEWPKIYPKLFFLAIIMFISSSIMFCIATWNLWSFWTIYIVFVTFMFTMVVISFI